MFSRLGTWCHDHRRLVLGLWVAVVVVGIAVSGAVGSAFRDEFNLPDVESRQGFDILDDHFGGQGTGGGHASCSSPTRASTTPRSRRAWRSCSPTSPRSTTSPGSRSPYAGATSA